VVFVEEKGAVMSFREKAAVRVRPMIHIFMLITTVGAVDGTAPNACSEFQLKRIGKGEGFQKTYQLSTSYQ
jgi:hypothetical protein